jgi:hypothetical protein
MARQSRARRRNRRKLRYQIAKLTPTYFVRLKLPRVEISPGRKWYIVRTMAHADRRVAEGIQSLGAEVYVPTLVEERVRRGKRVEVPGLPAAGYVFAGTGEGLGRVLAFGRCDGALEVMAGAGGPSEVDREALQVFADILTCCNEERSKPVRLRGLDSLRRLELSYGAG